VEIESFRLSDVAFMLATRVDSLKRIEVSIELIPAGESLDLDIHRGS
jgi:hypothetical protein